MTLKTQLLVLAISAGAVPVAAVLADRSDAASLQAPASASVQASGNAATGSKLFLQCRACHTVDRGAGHTVGPNLAGVVGAKAASRAGYTYSPALKGANLTWDKPTLDAWLTRPSRLVPGNKMAFAGMSNPQARADIIAYLSTLKK